MRCDARSNGRVGTVAAFQSLSGFLMRCDIGITVYRNPDLTFQSLSGFLMRCDQPRPPPALPALPGFNPYRVF